jgi:hypothetical protein
MPYTRLQKQLKIAQIKEMFENVPEIQDDSSSEDLDSSSDYSPDDEIDEKPYQTELGVRSTSLSQPNIHQLPQPSKSPKPPVPNPPQPPKSPSPDCVGQGTTVLNKKIRVRFGDQWLNGTVTEYDANKRLHTISFDDFNHSKLAPVNLANIHFEIVERHTKEATAAGKVLFSETVTTTHWTTDTTTVTKVTKLYS